MSTRSNIIVEFDGATIFLYRHSDGYPACNGVDLADALAQSTSASEFVQNLLDRRYEKQSYETKAKRIYELTTDLHGDIEWAYTVRYEFGKKPLVGWAHIGFEDREIRAPKADKTPAEFSAYVKAEEEVMLKRIAELEKKHGARL